MIRTFVRGVVAVVMLGAGSAIAAEAPKTSADAVAQLQTQVAALQKEVAELKAAQRTPELGQQMLELQIRHARLWFAGDAKHWVLAAFQLAELREALAGIVEANPEHEAIQPDRLDEVLPRMTAAPIKALQLAIDKRNSAGFAAAYDQLTDSCNACHTAYSFGFNQFQRPRTPLLDNQQYTPPPPVTPPKP